jgi:hypothetical protein
MRECCIEQQQLKMAETKSQFAAAAIVYSYSLYSCFDCFHSLSLGFLFSLSFSPYSLNWKCSLHGTRSRTDSVDQWEITAAPTKMGSSVTVNRENEPQPKTQNQIK